MGWRKGAACRSSKNAASLVELSNREVFGLGACGPEGCELGLTEHVFRGPTAAIPAIPSSIGQRKPFRASSASLNRADQRQHPLTHRAQISGKLKLARTVFACRNLCSQSQSNARDLIAARRSIKEPSHVMTKSPESIDHPSDVVHLVRLVREDSKRLVPKFGHRQRGQTQVLIPSDQRGFVRSRKRPIAKLALAVVTPTHDPVRRGFGAGKPIARGY